MKKGNLFKRLFSSLLVMVLMLSTGIISTNASQNDSEMTSGFYLSTGEVPSNIISYAQNNISDYLIAHSEVENIDLSNVIIGNPFSIGGSNAIGTDVYYFPVFQNSHILYTFRVYMDENGYTGILSSYLASELNSFMNSTTRNAPLLIYMESGNVMARLNGNEAILEESHLGYEPGVNVIREDPLLETMEVTDISVPIRFVEKPITAASASKVLSLDMKETQSDQQWCAAFVMASILRYKGAGSSITAETIVKHFHPNSSDLKNESVSRSQLVSYSKEKGFSKTTESSSTLSNSSVVSEINNDSPFYAGCAGFGSYKKARHALAVCGYNNNTSTYTVWNPWYANTETISQSSKTYVVNSESSFKWDCTIYKIRK